MAHSKEVIVECVLGFLFVVVVVIVAIGVVSWAEGGSSHPFEPVVRSRESLMTLVNDFDLTAVRQRMIERRGWEPERAKIAEAEYRRFLYLIGRNPGKVIVPWTQDLDDFWHEHIIDTHAYSKMCDRLNGRYVHHDPGLPKGSQKQRVGYERTLELLIAEFDDYGLRLTEDFLKQQSSRRERVAEQDAQFAAAPCEAVMSDNHSHDRHLPAEMPPDYGVGADDGGGSKGLWGSLFGSGSGSGGDWGGSSCGSDTGGGGSTCGGASCGGGGGD